MSRRVSINPSVENADLATIPSALTMPSTWAETTGGVGLLGRGDLDTNKNMNPDYSNSRVSSRNGGKEVLKRRQSYKEDPQQHHPTEQQHQFKRSSSVNRSANGRGNSIRQRQSSSRSSMIRTHSDAGIMGQHPYPPSSSSSHQKQRTNNAKVHHESKGVGGGAGGASPRPASFTNNHKEFGDSSGNHPNSKEIDDLCKNICTQVSCYVGDEIRRQVSQEVTRAVRRKIKDQNRSRKPCCESETECSCSSSSSSCCSEWKCIAMPDCCNNNGCQLSCCEKILAFAICAAAASFIVLSIIEMRKA